jgi:predicted transcriptional regulator
VSSGEKQEKSEPPQKLDLYVIARIIIVLKEKGSVNRTNLATSSGLSYDKLAKYLSWMNDKELVSSDGEGNNSLTEKGSQSYEELVSWIMRYVGKVRFPKI